MSENTRLYDPSMDPGEAVKEARGSIEEASRVQADAQAQMMADTIVAAVKSGKRAFINPTGKSYGFMVKPGKLAACYPGTQVAITPGAPSQNGIEMRRIGDIKAQFTGGMLIVSPEEENGEEIIAWAETHPNVCRDAMDPATETWAALRASQLDLAEKEPSLPANINVEAILNGDFSGFTQFESATQRARRMLAGVEA